MKKITSLFLVLIACCISCQEPKSNSKNKENKRELLPEPDKALREEYEKKQLINQSKNPIEKKSDSLNRQK